MVHRLWRAREAKLRRPVRGQHDQRNAGMGSLAYRRQVVRGRGAGGANESDRSAGRLGQAEGEEGSRALIDVDGDFQSRGVARREDQGTGSRSWAHAEVPDASRPQGIDQNPRPENVPVGGNVQSPVSAKRLRKEAALRAVSSHSAAGSEP